MQLLDVLLTLMHEQQLAGDSDVPASRRVKLGRFVVVVFDREIPKGELVI